MKPWQRRIRAILYAGAMDSPRSDECHSMLVLMDTAALLLATVTARGMAGGIFAVDGSPCPHTDRTVVTFYPDGSHLYTLQLARLFGTREARATLVAPRDNDMPSYIPAALATEKFAFVLEAFQDDGEPAAGGELLSMLEACALDAR